MLRRLVNNHLVPVVAASALTLAVLIVHIHYYYPFYSDDGFISLRYSQRLLEGKGLTWNDGERVEGYTNFLWVLGCAGIGLFRIDLLTAGRLLGFVSVVSTFVVFALLFGVSARENRRASFLRTLVPTAFLACSGSFAVWAVGGLEQPLLGACLVWGIYLIIRNIQHSAPVGLRDWLAAGVPLGLLCWTRPDGALVAGCLGIGLLVAGLASSNGSSFISSCRGRKRGVVASVCLLLVFPSAFVLALLAFRLAYYGDWVPNTAHVKIALTPERFEKGRQYVKDWLLPNIALLAFALTAVVPAIRDRKARARILLTVPLAIIWPLYIAVIGGDFFPGRRHMYIPVIISAFWAGEGFAWLITLRRRTHSWALLAAFVCTGVFLFDQVDDSQNAETHNYTWVWHSATAGKLLNRHFGNSGAVVALDGAGANPFYSRMTTIDMLGLNDKHIAKNRPGDFGRGKGMIGHDVGDGYYVLRQRPDIVLFVGSMGHKAGDWRSGRVMHSAPHFRQLYTMINVEAQGLPTLRGYWWLLRNSERLGAKQTDDIVTIPGFFFATGDAVAREDGDGNFGAVVADSAKGKASVANLAPGLWKLSVSASGANLSAIVNPKPGLPESGEPAVEPMVLHLEGSRPCDLDILLQPIGEGLTHVREVVLTRLDASNTPASQPP